MSDEELSPIVIHKPFSVLTVESKLKIQFRVLERIKNSELAEQGNAKGQCNLGGKYREGQGVARDDKQAVYWYEKSAEQGNATAQYNLGFMYARGRGVAQDDTLAHMWSNIAASTGYKNATENRDIVAKRMSLSQIEKAQDMAREWIAKH